MQACCQQSNQHGQGGQRYGLAESPKLEQQASRTALIKKYISKVPAPPEGKRVKLPQLLVLKETVENSNNVESGQQGTMMWRLHFQEWMAKPRNGAYTAEESDALFVEFCDKHKHPQSIVDYKHSNPKFPKDKARLWVNERDIINFTNINKRARSFELEEKRIKKVKQEDVDKAHKRIHEDADKIGGASAPMDALDTARAMMTSGTNPEHAFDGHSIHGGKLEDFRSESELESDNDDKADIADGEGKNSDDDDDDDWDSKTVASQKTPQQKKPTSKPKASAGSKSGVDGAAKTSSAKEEWFARDEYVAQQDRIITSWTSATQAALDSLQGDMEEVVKEIETGDLQKEVANEMAILKSKIEGREIGPRIWRRCGENLVAYTQAFKAKSDQPLASAGRASLGRAPPIRAYGSLKVMGYFQSSIDRVHMCKTKPAIDAIVAQVKPHRDAIAELRSVSKSAVTKAKTFWPLRRQRSSKHNNLPCPT